MGKEGGLTELGLRLVVLSVRDVGAGTGRLADRRDYERNGAPLDSVIVDRDILAQEIAGRGLIPGLDVLADDVEASVAGARKVGQGEESFLREIPQNEVRNIRSVEHLEKASLAVVGILDILVLSGRRPHEWSLGLSGDVQNGSNPWVGLTEVMRLGMLGQFLTFSRVCRSDRRPRLL